MRTRRSWRNQERAWRYLAPEVEAAPKRPEKTLEQQLADLDAQANNFLFGKRDRGNAARKAARLRLRIAVAQRLAEEGGE